MTMNLDSIEGLRDHGLYQILFRNAGVGLQFYEPPDGYDLKYDNSILIEGVTDYWRRYLIIRHYYPTLEEALTAELNRLELI